MTEPTSHLFAKATAALEDMHGLAIEGRASDVLLELSLVLARDLRAGARRLARIAEDIALASGRALQ